MHLAVHEISPEVLPERGEDGAMNEHSTSARATMPMRLSVPSRHYHTAPVFGDLTHGLDDLATRDHHQHRSRPPYMGPRQASPPA